MKIFIKLIIFYLSLFLSTTLIGSLLLFLPITGRKTISFIDAFFVTTSAFTVTGLSTVDIPSQFNTLGYIVILLLIQIGGLGIVAVALFALILFNKKISFLNRELLMITWNFDEFGGVIKILRNLFIYTIIVESAGFLLLSIKFLPLFGLKKGLFISLFTSISAFNNAGISLFSNNLMSFSSDLYINFVVSFLIILGGIGPLVVYDIVVKKRFNKLHLHTKIVITATAFLILFGTLSIFLLEYHHGLSKLSIKDKLLTSYFQSVSTRTAGFNTIELNHLLPATYALMIFLLFIWQNIRNYEYPYIFKRTIQFHQISKALSIALLSFILVIIVSLTMNLFQPDIAYHKQLFEVTSAFGTVGLSTGITFDLNTCSKSLIIIVMIVGKIGIITLLA